MGAFVNDPRPQRNSGGGISGATGVPPPGVPGQPGKPAPGIPPVPAPGPYRRPPIPGGWRPPAPSAEDTQPYSYHPPDRAVSYGSAPAQPYQFPPKMPYGGPQVIAGDRNQTQGAQPYSYPSRRGETLPYGSAPWQYGPGGAYSGQTGEQSTGPR